MRNSREDAPKGYAVDHNRIRVGMEVEGYDQAMRAEGQSKMFDMPWVGLFWADTPVQEGARLAVQSSHLGFWSLNACRIVYVIEEHEAHERFGFACDMLEERGKQVVERFSV
jgi:uncharacterized protein (UPF0548 family)